jgi:hypothetical protein
LKKIDRFGFGFTSLKLKKPNRTESEPKKNRKKTEPNQKNLAKPVFVLKNRTETGRFEPVSVFLKKISIWFFFFVDKNQTKPKMTTPNFLQYQFTI